jgi:GTPase
MLVDEVEVIFRGGHGGAGIVSFGAKEGSGPDGGNGGRGGDLYIVAKNDITLLNQFKAQQSFQAGDASHGGKNKQTGKDGKDVDILLPIGTTIINTYTNEFVAELTYEDERILIAEGGKGGKGNYEFRSPRNTTPQISQPGKPGRVQNLKLILKLIADYGFIGLPNAGKSSLLNELTNAQAKIGNYAFTTLSPNLGVFQGKIIADIPGLIEGAHEGKGLGIGFLKHIEKVKTLLHVISAESTDPLKDYKTIREEMGSYKKELLEKDEIILVTKSDLIDEDTLKNILKKFKGKRVFPISIHDFDSLEKLKSLLV